MDGQALAPAFLAEGKRLRLYYLDGLRGLAALHVALLHGFMGIAWVKDWLPDRWVEATRWVGNGRVSVQIFIALSGYCLMMPVARTGYLQGGKRGFILRRMRRILPPYYAALALSLAVVIFVPGLGTPQGLESDTALPATTPGVVLSHLFLFQDLSVDWILKIQGPLWTIAQEWQIYFVFAFLLLPMWHRAGSLVTLAFTFVASVLMRRMFGFDLTFAAPQFLFLFGVGMFAATVSFPGEVGWLAALRDRVPWAWPAAVLWLIYVALWLRYPDTKHLHSLPYAVIVSGAIFCTLLLCTQAAQEGRRDCWTLRFFEWGPVVVLGTFSYSLYLIHQPVLNLFTLALRRRDVPGWPAVGVVLLVGVPVALALAYGFHLVFERPFMRGHPKSLPRAEKAAVLDAAP